MQDRWIAFTIVSCVLIFFGMICIIDYIDTYTKISMAKQGYEQASIIGSSYPKWQKSK